MMSGCRWHRLMLVAVLAIGTIATTVFAEAPPHVEIKDGWRLIAADQARGTGADISKAGYSTGGWHVVQHMPSTVLAVLEADGTYPNLYHGTNLTREVPQNLWKLKWWYRTTFSAPSGAHVFWLDFPGINYRADIWLNGQLVAGDNAVAGMYADHRFNVTRFVKPGASNALAVEVTPEQLIRDVDGVELGDSWHDWINWKYHGYHGALDAKVFRTKALTAVYLPAKGTAPQRMVTTAVKVVSASTSVTTLQAEILSQGLPVNSGTVRFLDHGRFLGFAAIHPAGAATLTLARSTELLLASGGISFVPDRNAGIWKPVYLDVTGPVKLSDALVDTSLPLPALSPARLTVYVNLTNGVDHRVSGELQCEITRAGKPAIRLSKDVSLDAGAKREVSFDPSEFPSLVVDHPDLWWPYTMGKPALYQLHLQFRSRDGVISDSGAIRFGIREVTQHRDQDNRIAPGSNFYLQVNGKNFLVRGAAYTPGLLYQDSPEWDRRAILYAKDLGINMLRSEGKIASQRLVELADEAGVPLMYGWMCCNQWERWSQWSRQDDRVAGESLRSQILMLRSHPSVFLWANGSDGRPPDNVRAEYHRILKTLHWQNAVVDTVSNFARAPGGQVLWDGIQMMGPYSWRPPSYWFANRYVGAEGSIAEEGDNENIPPYRSLEKFLPGNKLWPPNEDWYSHAGATEGNNRLYSTRLAVSERYGPVASARELAEEAQLGAYENTRAQFEDFAANGWATHKMTIYWMFDEPWPSFFGHLYDFYGKPGGAYFGAKKGLRPVSVVFDYYATGSHDQAKIRVVNETLGDRFGLRVRVRIYDLDGRTRYDRTVSAIDAPALSAHEVLALPLISGLSSTYFVRCELFASSGQPIVDNVYWQSTTLDDVGAPSGQNAFRLHQVSWANFTALKTMPRVSLRAEAALRATESGDEVAIKVTNPGSHVAFFERLTVTSAKGGDEILPITYSDNDITLFPGETKVISAHTCFRLNDRKPAWLRIDGYNTDEEEIPIR